jgi:class 3 adenylate cyclase
MLRRSRPNLAGDDAGFVDPSLLNDNRSDPTDRIQSSRPYSAEEANEVSYTILDTTKNANDILQSLATAINVRLSLDSEQDFPFVEFDNFATASRQDKIFLYGPGGSGKSRSIYEIAKRNIPDIKRIIIINPRNNTGSESGRIRLADVVSKFSDGDAVIWDNFPDDLVKRDAANARYVLEMVSSRSIKKLLVALKPKYLEVLREVPAAIAEFYTHRITYDRESIKNIVKLYGTHLKRYKAIYDQVISKDLDRIAKLLWQREPIPLTILDYYYELMLKLQRVQEPANTGHVKFDAVAEAENLLRSTNYYEHQFALLVGFRERRSDVEFLYTMRLCYELGISRGAANIEKLQNEIFGTNPPMAPTEKLSTWVYLSGNYYSMHDVCREAVRFTDFVRLKILDYLSDPSRVIGRNKDSKSIEHSLALFLGRSVQHLPRESSGQLVPEGLSNHTKRSPSFGRAFGQGVGEVFDSLDEELQNTILLRVDVDVPFASGLAESLGHSFPSLDSEKRQIVLQKIYSGLLFARYFGQSIGRLMPYLSVDIQREVFAHMEWNPQFADGVGMGFGYIYSSLDEDTKKQVFLFAEKNIDMARGLGCGFGLTFPSLGPMIRAQVMSQADFNSEFDKGVGMGLGELFHEKLSEDLKADVLQRRSVRSEFALGLGISIARSNAERSYDDLMDLLDNDAELAHGLGMGYGASIDYLSIESLSHLISLANENERFDLGLGSGIGFLYKHLAPELQKRFFDRGSTNNEFDQGLGFGIGFTWMYQSAEMRSRAFARSASHSAFAYGLGYGVGYHFRYFEDPLKQDVIRKSDHDAEFARGLGYGLGYSFPYLDLETKRIILERTETDPKFALGLGTGLGRVLRYLPVNEKEMLFTKASGNPEFGKGLGFGLGRYVIMYTDREFQKDIFAKMKSNIQLAYGLGQGLAYSYTHISVEFQNRIMGQMALDDNEFAKGLGAGFGANLRYLPLNLRDRLFSYAEQNIGFARGFGEAIGTVFGYLNGSLRERALGAATTESAFAQGLGQGLGSVYPYLQDNLAEEAFRRTESNGLMTRGLGAGLASVYTYLPLQLQKEVFEYATRGREFLHGFGEGFGLILSYRHTLLSDERVSLLLQDNEFLIGLGRGIGSSFTYSDDELQAKFASLGLSATLNDNFYSGLGQGVGSVLAGLSPKLREHVFALSERIPTFAKSLAFSIARVFQYLPASLQSDIIYKHLNVDANFAYGFGLGMGHGFVFLTPEVQERALSLSRQSRPFSQALGLSLGRVFTYLDAILQQEILRNQELNPDFAEGLGIGLGLSFPLLPANLREILIPKLEATSSEPSLGIGLAKGLGESMKYLQRNIQDRLAVIADRNISVKNIMYDPTKRETADNDYFEDFSLVPITFASSGQFQTASSNMMVGAEEISFSGQRSTCSVCIVDMVNSTGVTSGLNDVQLARYYSVFLNSMAMIARNFGAKIIKNAGDSLLFYFPRTVDSANPVAFKDVLECGITMIAAHAAINAKLLDEKMPPVNYRISADHGKVEIARSVSSQSEDFFGPVMNKTAKINSKATVNGMAIGNELYKIVKVLDEYIFDNADSYLQEDRTAYPIYHVKSRDSGSIINPFKRTSNLG